MILFFGCWTNPAGFNEAGHFFRANNGDTRVRHRKGDGTLNDQPEQLVPWGFKVDGELAPRTTDRSQARNGWAGYHQAISWVDAPAEEAWSLLSWWDNSVDSRPGSSCAFMVDRRATPEEILAEARTAFPQIFARFKYDIVLPVSR